jgi:hypothetical protein
MWYPNNVVIYRVGRVLLLYPTLEPNCGPI